MVSSSAPPAPKPAAVHQRAPQAPFSNRRRRGQEHGRVAGAEPDAGLVELGDEGDELADSTLQPIEIEIDEDIALKNSRTRSP